MPFFNILTRVSRPNFFAVCKNSVINQTYKNYKHILAVDNVDIEGIKVTTPKHNKEETFPANHHINTLLDHTEDGFIIYLDDDDVFFAPDSLEILAKHLTSENDLLICKTLIPKYRKKIDLTSYNPEDCIVLPRQYPLKVEEWRSGWPEVISKNFVHHTKNKVTWKPIRGGDYQAFRELWQRPKNVIYLDRIITAMQIGINCGSRVDLQTAISGIHG